MCVYVCMRSCARARVIQSLTLSLSCSLSLRTYVRAQVHMCACKWVSVVFNLSLILFCVTGKLIGYSGTFVDNQVEPDNGSDEAFVAKQAGEVIDTSSTTAPAGRPCKRQEWNGLKHPEFDSLGKITSNILAYNVCVCI